MAWHQLPRHQPGAAGRDRGAGRGAAPGRPAQLYAVGPRSLVVLVGARPPSRESVKAVCRRWWFQAVSSLGAIADYVMAAAMEAGLDHRAVYSPAPGRGRDRHQHHPARLPGAPPARATSSSRPASTSRCSRCPSRTRRRPSIPGPPWPRARPASRWRSATWAAWASCWCRAASTAFSGHAGGENRNVVESGAAPPRGAGRPSRVAAPALARSPSRCRRRGASPGRGRRRAWPAASTGFRRRGAVRARSSAGRPTCCCSAWTRAYRSLPGRDSRPRPACNSSAPATGTRCRPWCSCSGPAPQARLAACLGRAHVSDILSMRLPAGLVEGAPRAACSSARAFEPSCARSEAPGRARTLHHDFTEDHPACCGALLSKEPDLDRLMERIVIEP